MAWEWRKELEEEQKKINWKEFEASPFTQFAEPLRKLGFTPTRVVHYRCMYKSDFPSRKWILRRHEKGITDTAVFYECIHNFEMKLIVTDDIFKTGPLGSSTFYMEQMFCDFLLEKLKCLSVLSSTSVFRHYKNKPKIIYNRWQTRNQNLLPNRLPKKKLMLMMLSFIAFARKTPQKPTTTK